MNRQLLNFIFSLIFLPGFQAQSLVKKLTLEDVIAIAKNQSPSALQAKNKFRNSYWSHNTFLANKLPSINLNATVPSYDHGIDKLAIPGGDYVFTEHKYISTNADITMRENVALTGGSVFMTSNLQTLRNYDNIATGNSFLSNPLRIGFTQPIFAFNNLKWDNKIEPLRYTQAKKQYLEDMENVAEQATNSFFDLLTAQANLKIAELNKWNNDTLLEITKGRFNIGRIAENELLQMELNSLNSENALAQAELDVKLRIFKLKSFLGIKDDSQIELDVSVNTKFFTVDLKKAQTFALENRPSIIDNQVQLIQASRDIARAKRENRFAVNAIGSYGLTQSTLLSLGDAYLNPQSQQQFTLGFQVPILDWGMAKSRIKMAIANQELIRTNVEQAQADFEQDIFLKVTQFNMQQRQLFIASKADTVAAKRFEITKYRYRIGKIDIQTLSIAQNEKDISRKNYIEALRSYWNNFFEIRKITLYDFEAEKPLDVVYSELIK